MVYGKEKADRLEQKLIETYGEGSRVPIMKLRENEDADIREIAQYVYENVFFILHDEAVGAEAGGDQPGSTGRVPVLISYDNRYFRDKYRGECRRTDLRKCLRRCFPIRGSRWSAARTA